MPIYKNNRAKDVKTILRRLHAAVPTARQAAAKFRVKSAFRNLLAVMAAGPNGRAAVRLLKKVHKRYKKIQAGTRDPTADEAIHLLRTLIPHLPSNFFCYDHGELHDIAPVVAHISQTEGKALYHVVTKLGLSDFLQKLSEGWGPDTYPLSIDCEGDITPVARIKYGVCKHDLPQSRAQQNMDKKALGEKYKQGIFDWSPPPFIQSDPNRRAGAKVYLHMGSGIIIPTFRMKDKNGAEVAERDITPDADDYSAYVDMLVTKDLRCHARAVDINTKILVRAARYIIWAKRQDPANITPERAATAPLDLSAEGLGLITPVSHYDVFTEIVAHLREAADQIDSNMATQN